MADQQQVCKVFRCVRSASLLEKNSFAGMALGPIKSAKICPVHIASCHSPKSIAKYFSLLNGD
jgi:hypothetical protein